jgi:glycosyltransferase involved in cell wall biosynthesis
MRLVSAAGKLAVQIMRMAAKPARDASPSAKPCIVYLSFVEWHGAKQRPRHFAECLSKKWDVIYVNALRLHHAADRAPSPSPAVPNLKVVNPIALPGERRLKFAHDINDRLILDAAMRELRGRIPDAVIVNSPALAPVALRLPKRVLIYDLMDEFTSDGPAAERYRRNEEDLFREADFVFTGTQSLFDSRKGRHPRLEFLPGGCDFQHFASGDPQRAPAVLQQIQKPVVGYFGALNERLHRALLERLASETGWSIVLIGPRYRTAPRLPSAPNVHVLGACPYEKLPHALAAFDVSIIPYRTDGATRMVNPVKALEYMAGGKPVVSTALPDVERLYGAAALIAKDAEEFAALVRKAIAAPESLSARIEAGKILARERSWSKAAGRLSETIEKALQENQEG